MRITKLEKITNERWLNLYAALAEHNGKTVRWVFASRKDPTHPGDLPDAVVIVPLLKNPGEPTRLVMIREYRVPINGYNYGLPAGLPEAGESTEDAVRREMVEETGMVVTAFKKISPPIFSSTGMTDESAVLVFVDVRSTSETKQKLDVSEDIEVILLDHAAVCRLCDHPDLPIDAKAWGVLYLYQQLGTLE